MPYKSEYKFIPAILHTRILRFFALLKEYGFPTRGLASPVELVELYEGITKDLRGNPPEPYAPIREHIAVEMLQMLMESIQTRRKVEHLTLTHHRDADRPHGDLILGPVVTEVHMVLVDLDPEACKAERKQVD